MSDHSECPQASYFDLDDFFTSEHENIWKRNIREAFDSCKKSKTSTVEIEARFGLFNSDLGRPVFDPKIPQVYADRLMLYLTRSWSIGTRDRNLELIRKTMMRDLIWSNNNRENMRIRHQVLVSGDNSMSAIPTKYEVKRKIFHRDYSFPRDVLGGPTLFLRVSISIEEEVDEHDFLRLFGDKRRMEKPDVMREKLRVSVPLNDRRDWYTEVSIVQEGVLELEIELYGYKNTWETVWARLFELCSDWRQGD